RSPRASKSNPRRKDARARMISAPFSTFLPCSSGLDTSTVKCKVNRRRCCLTVTVSSKYQLVIPQEIREALDISPGQKLQFMRIGRSVRLVPVESLGDLEGAGPGMPTQGFREKEDRSL